MHFFAEGAVDRVEVFTVLSRTRGIDKKLVSAETPSKVVDTKLSEDYSCYGDLESAAARFRGELLSPQMKQSGESDNSPDYYVDIDRKFE